MPFWISAFLELSCKCINRYRIHLKITTLSDITEGDGSTMKRNILQGYHAKTPHSQYLWPNQPCPYHKAWIRWRQTLKFAFPLQAGRLVNVIGQWLDNIYHQWGWYYSPCTDKFYHQLPTEFQTFSREGNRGPRGYQPICHTSNTSHFLPLHTHQATCSSLSININI